MRYTTEEIKKIKVLLSNGLLNKEIAKTIGRTLKGFKFFLYANKLGYLRKESKKLRNKEMFAQYQKGKKIKQIAKEKRLSITTVYIAVRGVKNEYKTK